MKTSISMQMLKAVNALRDTMIVVCDFEVFVHAEDSTSEYWGIYSHKYGCYYIVARHGSKYAAYECKDRTHVRYMMIKMAL